MKINLDQEMQKLLPWEYIVTLGGVDYPTRAPMLSELIRVQDLVNEDKARQHSVAEGVKIIDGVRELALGFFVGGAGKPDLSDHALVIVFLRGYMEYFRQHTQKKSQAWAIPAVATAKKKTKGRMS